MAPQPLSKKPVSEGRLRSWISHRIRGCWHCFLEPSLGSSTGVPDLLVLFPSGYNCTPLPVELKLGWQEGNRVFTLAIRPAQIRWHDELGRAGGKSCILFGLPQPEGGYLPLVLAEPNLATLRHWRRGIPIGELASIRSPTGIDLLAWERAMGMHP